MLKFDFDAGWDFILKNTYGKQILSVQLRCRLKMSPTWAAQFRRNLLAHKVFPITPYFLIALPDQFYLWTDSSSHQDEDEPDYIIDATPIFTPYVERTGVQLEMIRKYELEMLLMSWFFKIMQADAYSKGKLAEYPWLLDSGLYAALVGKAVAAEATT